MAEFGDQLLESVDRAAGADPRMDRVASGAQLLVLGLQVEAAVEVERRAVLVELGADPGMIGKDEIDLLGTRQQGPLDRGRGNAFGTFLLDPFDRGHERSRLDRNAQDHFVLDDEPSDRLPDRARLSAEQADQKRQKIQDSDRSHLSARPHRHGFAAKR